MTESSTPLQDFMRARRAWLRAPRPSSVFSGKPDLPDLQLAFERVAAGTSRLTGGASELPPSAAPLGHEAWVLALLATEELARLARTSVALERTLLPLDDKRALRRYVTATRTLLEETVRFASVRDVS